MKKKMQRTAPGPEPKIELYHGSSARIVGIGIWLKELREGAHLSQQGLAKMLRVDRSTVFNWEHARYAPSAENLIALGNLFGYPAAKEAWVNAGVDSGLLKNWEKLLPEKALRVTHPLFPFASGDLVAVEDSQAEDLSGLFDELVAVRFTTYPAEFAFEYRELEDLSGRTWTCPAHPGIIREQPGSCPTCKMALEPNPDKDGMVPLGITWTCRRHPGVVRDRPGSCPECEMDLPPDIPGAAHPTSPSSAKPQAFPLEPNPVRWVQAGWLRLQLANDPYFSMPLAARRDDRGPWRLVLQGAALAAVIPIQVPLTAWEKEPRSKKYRDLQLPGKEVLGRVVSWQRANRLG